LLLAVVAVAAIKAVVVEVAGTELPLELLVVAHLLNLH
jgi:hypothetical protein